MIMTDLNKTSLVFVYGSLKRGGWSNHRLERQDFKGVDYLEGLDMIGLGSYPGVVKGKGSVQGEVYTRSPRVTPPCPRITEYSPMRQSSPIRIIE